MTNKLLNCVSISTDMSLKVHTIFTCDTDIRQSDSHFQQKMSCVVYRSEITSALS